MRKKQFGKIESKNVFIYIRNFLLVFFEIKNKQYEFTYEAKLSEILNNYAEIVKFLFY